MVSLSPCTARGVRWFIRRRMRRILLVTGRIFPGHAESSLAATTDGSEKMSRERLCIVVKTYPQPSIKYQELVCCGAISESGQWRRLYPIPFRRLPEYQKFSKYSWITAELSPETDGRPESYRPDVPSMVIESSAPMPAGDWRERMSLIYAAGVHSIESLKAPEFAKKVSMSTVRVGRIDGMDFRETDPDITKKWGEIQSQPQLPGIDQEVFRALQPMPFTFQYQFHCDDEACKGHDITTTDWEVAALYTRKRSGGLSTGDAADAVCRDFLDRIARPGRSLHFFVGTTVRYGTWIIGGVAYPPQGTIDSLLDQERLL